MRTIVLALVSAIAISSHNALAVDPPAQPPTPVVPPAPSAPPSAALSKDHIDHLKTAAEHLAKAGRKDEADKLLEQIAAFESGQAEALLAKKEKELDALRVEVDQLRKLTRRVPQIVLSFQVFEASRTRLEAAKIPQTQLLFPKGGDKFQPAVVHTVANAAAARECIEALRKKELLKVLAEPTLVTISGRQALFHSGGEFPVTLPQAQGNASLEFRKFGTQIEALPMLVGGGKVRVHVRAKVSEIDPARTVKVNGSEIPGLRERAVETAAELAVWRSAGPQRACPDAHRVYGGCQGQNANGKRRNRNGVHDHARASRSAGDGDTSQSHWHRLRQLLPSTWVGQSDTFQSGAQQVHSNADGRESQRRQETQVSCDRLLINGRVTWHDSALDGIVQSACVRLSDRWDQLVSIG